MCHQELALLAGKSLDYSGH
uniref:Uncharacterized protein n=1 Tax=Arundo donax TaxID=35708 RepID=A0A0A8XZ12_ARUDO